MRKLFLIICFSIFLSSEAFAQKSEIYVTKRGDNIEIIIKKLFSKNLTPQKKEKIKNSLRKKNSHIRDWIEMRVGSRVDYSGVDSSIKEIIEIVDDESLYLDQALYQIYLSASLSSITYKEDFSSFEVQSDNQSISNYGLELVYSYGKHPRYLRYHFSYESFDVEFFDSKEIKLKFLRDRLKKNTRYYLALSKYQQNFSTLNKLQTKVRSSRDFIFAQLGLSFKYYFLKNPAFFDFSLAYSLDSEGTNVIDDTSAFKLHIENTYTFFKNIGITPYIDYLYVSSSQNSNFFNLGVRFHFLIDII